MTSSANILLFIKNKPKIVDKYRVLENVEKVE